CHSAYSFLDGASLPEELVLQAHALGYRALALTDHDGLYGSMAFAQEAKAWGIQPITGAEVTLELGADQGTKRAHLTLLAESPVGYANLCRLLSHAHLSHPKGEPALDWKTLSEHTAGLIALSGCRRGEIAQLIDAGREAAAVDAARRYRAAFGPANFWIELQQNRVRGDTPRLRRLVALSRSLGLGIVATNNVHYHVRERHRLQDVLVAIRHRTSLDASHRLRRPNSEFYLKPPEEMAALFSELPEAVRATEHIAERCAAFDLTADLGYTFPDFNRQGHSGSADEILAKTCRRALALRYAGEPADLRARAERRLEEELELVRRHGLSGFFLVYQDLLHLAEQVAAEVRGPSPARRAAHLPPGRGRGSSVSSIICYLIGLSHVDPVRNNLFMGRFLNEAMHAVPDIDLDFARDIREALIERVYQHYGQEHAALVCSFSTYRLRSAVRDVGKALGLPAADLDKLARLSESGTGKDLAAAMRAIPEFADRVEAPLWRDLIELVGEIAGFPRHVSQHVGGMIISSRPLVEIVPIEKARMPGRIVCQWDKDSCDDARFIKVDFLGLGMLSLVEECIELIAEHRGEIVDLSRIPFDDPAVYDSICRGDTVGVFQIESRAQIQMLPRTQPRSLDDLAVEVAIVRPGPIVGGAVNPYVARRMAAREAAKRGEVYTPPLDHPLLEPTLAETLGVILYQDQVLQVAIALAGFTAGQADSLRRALSRKRARAAIELFRTQFLEGAQRKGVSREVAESVFEKIVAFSEFGFPKSHAYAFAVLAYQSAWLRLYYPAEYTAALFNSQPMGFYPTHVLVRDAQRRGIAILPPDLNRSRVGCSVEGDAVRIGFRYVKHLGTRIARQIELERARRGPFASLTDFVRRVDPPREAVESLIDAGACDSLGRPRRALLWELGLLSASTAVPGHRGRIRQLPLPLSAESGPV
ncbi:MAG TPA: DNA polymerase III subunit alpha, partial [Limnochordia bacterium]